MVNACGLLPKMKPRLIRIFISCALFGSVAFARPVIQKGDVVAVCGDSLTDQREYSVYIEEYLLMCQPAPGVKTLECGWGGSTTPHFASHMGRDVMTLSPTVATIEFGVNDAGSNVMDATAADHYREGLKKLIANFQRGNTRTVIIGSPVVVDTFYFRNSKHPDVSAAQFNETLGQFGEIVKEVAASSQGVVFADLHSPMMEAMAKSKAKYGERYPFSNETDGVHGGPNYHLVMAYGFLKAMGFDGNIGTIVYDDATGAATAAGGHRVVSSQPGKIVIESSRFPFCFFHGTLDADQQSSPGQFTGNWRYGDAPILPFVPFNQDLNRYTLTVQNLKSPKAKITWGEEFREFTAAELARGINLAAEFLKNPFVKPFAAVEKAVLFKQDFETQFISHFLYDRTNLMQMAPGKSAAIDQMESGFRGVHEGLLEQCERAVKPVTHTILIEPAP